MSEMEGMAIAAEPGLVLGLVATVVAAPLMAAAVVAFGGFPRSPRTPAVAGLGVALAASALLSWLCYAATGLASEFGPRFGGGSLVHVDGITATLLPTVALIELAIVLVAPKRFLDPAATLRLLLGAAATSALFSTAHPLALVVLWIVTALPMWISTRGTPGGRPAARVFATVMILALACMTGGTLLMLVDPPWERDCGLVGNAGGWLVALAVLMRKGIVPFHSWYPALFSGAPLSTALAATMPQVAAYTAVRLLMGHADHGAGVGAELFVLSQLALVTAAYGAALALVQRDLRGLIGTLAMSQSALVLAGLAGKLPMELNGALCVWISSGLALTGIGLVAWALESRAGPLSLATPQGRFYDAPALAALFLIFGLAAIGLPGTLSFVADDLIVSGSLDEQLHAGLLVIASTVLSGIAVMRGWFFIFGGPTAVDGPRHTILLRERFALTALLVPLFAFGLWPGPLVATLERAAEQLLGVTADGESLPTPGGRGYNRPTMTTAKRTTRGKADTVDIEGLGVFYLGRKCDPKTGKGGSEPLLVDARRFTTHAVCVGMTGSGKTGLLIDLVEEAAIDGVPTLVIDPKGDLANVLLAFPDLAPADFLPWVEADAAKRDGLTLEALAERTAKKWKDGLAASGQSPERIARLKAAVDMAVYTPGSRAGRPLAMLESLEAPGADVLDDPEARRERIESLVSGILALAGIDAEPGRSREHVLVSSIVDALWKSGQKIDFGTLVRAIPAPPVERIGFLDLENFYPAGDRFQLASRLNTVAAAPGFEAWLAGEPLDVGRLLWTAEGKPRVSVVSIAHLNDAQRMAFVTLLAGQTVAWMRSQGGTSSLKALFLMDEVFGYVPPTANPPSKGPILTLLKQARAFGLGVVLATQNPVDLDYKGLSNAGIWFLGRLQTARDKARVLDGLEGAASSAGRSFDRNRLDKLLSGLEQRMFLLHSVHDDEETVFQTRWTLAYLRGPLLREEIKRLTAERAAPGTAATQPEVILERPDAGLAGGAGQAGSPRPILPPGVREVFLAPTRPVGPDATLVYEPAILGRARVRYAKAAARVDVDREVICLAPAGDSVGESAWEAADVLSEPPEVEPAPRTGSFASLPSALSGPKGYAALGTALKGHLARTAKLVVYVAPDLDAVSRPGESEADFRVRITQRAKEWRDAQIDEVRSRYAQKIAALVDKVDRARQKVEREKAEAKNQSMQTYVSIGSAVLGALLGRKMASSTTIGKAATSMRSASRAARQQADVAHAEESLTTLEERRQALEEEVDAELERIRVDADPSRIKLEPIEIPAKKTDISVDDVVLAWIPT